MNFIFCKLNQLVPLDEDEFEAIAPDNVYKPVSTHAPHNLHKRVSTRPKIFVNSSSTIEYQPREILTSTSIFHTFIDTY